MQYSKVRPWNNLGITESRVYYSGMPSRNVIKVDIPDSYYHVYARGISRSTIFHDDEDRATFLNLFKRYLSSEPTFDDKGRAYHHLHDDVVLLAFCLMSNHFHLMFYQHEAGAICQLMRGVMTSYSRYFNTKYQRSGPLFESRYKASRISDDAYLYHISRYIHLNPEQWRTWQWSSLPYYLGEKHAEWIDPTRILELFSSRQKYLEFVEDYEDNKRVFDSIKHELADR